MKKITKKMQKKLDLFHKSKEYEYMWSKLAKHPSNKGLKHPTVALSPGSYEVWQYLGLTVDNSSHVFRHRDHPNIKYHKNSSLRVLIPVKSMEEVKEYFINYRPSTNDTSE